MCEWCTKHGEGKKWYLNVKNYSKELAAKNPDTERYMEEFIRDVEKIIGTSNKFYWAIKLPLLGRVLKWWDSQDIKKFHFGQVIPLEDAKKIMDIASPIAKVSCVCRRMSRGLNEKTCICTGLFLDYLKEWPDYTRGGIDYISKNEAIELLEKGYKKGFVQSVWNVSSPYVASICQCEYPTCQGLRLRLDKDLRYVFLKSEYMAEINIDKCNGCKKCLTKCQFKAISYSPELEKSFIDPEKCYGCGLCRSACESNAITLIDRNKITKLKNSW